jgi:hypothetical protein
MLCEKKVPVTTFHHKFGICGKDGKGGINHKNKNILLADVIMVK